MKKYENVPLESQIPQYERWAKCLNPGQMGNVFFLPWVGMMYRIAHFEVYEKKVKVIEIYDQDGEGQDLIAKLPNKGKVIVVLRRVLLSPDGMRIARDIEKWLVNFEGGVFFVHEIAPCQLLLNRNWPSWVMANQLNYRLLDKEDVRRYIKNVAREMKTQFTELETGKIYEAYGGWLWLVKDVIRSKKEHEDWDFEKILASETVQQKMQLLWESWPNEYREYLLGIVKNEQIEKEMKEIGLIDKEGVLVGEELRKFVQKQKIEDLIITQEKLEYKKHDLTDRLQLGERRVISKLWEKKGLFVSREEVAKLFWDESESYEATDWAIDQKMRRLRARVQKLGLPVRIVTKKGEGYGVASD